MTVPLGSAATVAGDVPVTEPHDICIAAIDPSTDVTGACLVQFRHRGVPTVLAVDAFDATEAYDTERARIRRETKAQTGKIAPAVPADVQRFTRIAATSFWLFTMLYRAKEQYATAFDLVAYEEPCQRGAANTAALHQAIGAYMTKAFFVGLPVAKINASTVKACAIGAAFRRSGQTAADLSEKERMVTWANATFGRADDPNCKLAQAKADALAVAWAAYKRTLTPAKPKKKRAAAKKVAATKGSL